MDPRSEHELRIMQMQFIGKIIAGFTHEIKNYIAIINESTGLIGDMMKLGKSPEHELPAYLDIVHSIEDHVEKANVHFRYLNRFAHRMDEPLSSFPVHECVEELVALLKRFANQKRIGFQQDYVHDIPPVYSNPSLLQLIVFTIIEKYIRELEQNGMITIQITHADNSVIMNIVPNGKRLEGGNLSFPDDLLAEVMKELGGTITRDTGKETIIRLPLKSS